MPRQLRSRRSRPNYASLHTGEEVEAYVPDPEEQESGSEFAANDSDGNDRPDAADDDAEPDAEDPEDERGGEAGPSSRATPRVKKAKPKSQGPTTRSRKSVPVGLSKPTKSVPPTHHRHRPPPLFRRDAQVERLLDPPTLFHPSTIAPTNSFTSSVRTMKRLERSWGRNVGPGPVHELLEDRAWFKEATPDAAVASEAGRRPVVYDAVKLDGKYQVISERSVPCASISPYRIEGIYREASSYLICTTGPEARGLSCHFGPFGNQTKAEIKPLEGIDLCVLLPAFSFLDSQLMSGPVETMPQSNAHVFNTGGPVWGLDWCPLHPDVRERRCNNTRRFPRL